MNRLYDRIMAQWKTINIFAGEDDDDHDTRLQNYIDFMSSTVIVADNVQEYFLREIAPALSIEDYDHYYQTMPLSRPPLDLIFIEFNYEPNTPAIGIHIRRIGNYSRPRLERVGPIDNDEDARTFLAYVIVEILPNKVYDVDNLYVVTLDKLGRIEKIRGNPEPPDNGELNSDHLNLLFFGLSLINCKNVELVDRKPSAGLSRKHERRAGQPLVTYKVIKIQSMRDVKHTTDLDALPKQPTEGESNQPLSIWRGHFKDFRDGKGLFGKHKSVYWWDQHARGSIENGAVIKDYDVKAPKE